MAKHRLLVIDDNAAIHNDFRKILALTDVSAGRLAELRRSVLGGEPAAPESASYDVEYALQGQEGLDRLTAARAAGTPFALAFVDMRMPPGWDGIETIKHLWAEDPELQVVICTAYTDYSPQDILRQLGRTDRLILLKKPFDAAEVMQLACAMTEKWSVTRQARGYMQRLEERVRERTSELETANRRLEGEIQERVAAEERLRHEAFHDSLTGLPNRAMLVNHLRERIGGSGNRDARGYAVLFLDLDSFKIINDSLGHEVGDALLVKIAARLQEVTRLPLGGAESSSLVARLGGDEFVVLVDGLPTSEDAVAAGQRVLDELARPVTVGPHQLVVGASIGIARGSGGDESPEVLLRNADIAMYRAKAAGRARLAAFDDAMHVDAVRRLQLENDLRQAIDRNEFELHYQPIVALPEAQITAFEALLRWRHPQLGPIAPSDFISIAEETGLIVPLGRWVLREACSNLARWNALRPHRSVAVSVNISRRQMVEPGIVDAVRDALGEAGADPSLLKLEITETVIMEATDSLVETLRAVRDLGVELFMDDFGTGYSSLTCLHRFPFNVLKIDQAFLRNLDANAQYAAIVNAVVSLAHNLSMKVTAEGIETEEQMAQILALDCDFGQGYLLGRPMPAGDADALIAADQLVRRAA